MKKLYVIILSTVFFLACQAQPDPVNFSEDALNDTFISLDGEFITFQSILNQYKGQTIVIDVWASWCRDCIVGFPNLKTLQEDYPDVVYLFLSMDKSQKSWKKGIEKYDLKGDHYFMPSGWDSTFSDAIDLDWIPRYMVVDKDGSIKLFKAIKVTDPKLKASL